MKIDDNEFMDHKSLNKRAIKELSNFKGDLLLPGEPLTFRPLDLDDLFVSKTNNASNKAEEEMIKKKFDLEEKL
jgi:hypothetical protein